MRWRDRVEVGDKRVRSAFLLLPRRIAGETRWLERSAWEEELRSAFTDFGWIAFYDWRPVRWVER